jgi:hypothetical protein
MGILGTTHTAKVRGRSNTLTPYSTLKAILVKVLDWFNLAGLSL